MKKRALSPFIIAAEALRILREKKQQEQQLKKQQDDAEEQQLREYVETFRLEKKYADFISYHGRKDNLESLRDFVADDDRIGGSSAALAHIYVNDLQPNFIFFQSLPEYRNKSIDEQLALFGPWYDENGPRKAVF